MSTSSGDSHDLESPGKVDREYQFFIPGESKNVSLFDEA